MKKLMSFLLVAFLIAGSVGLNVCADEDILVQLSTDKDDYISIPVSIEYRARTTHLL